MASMRWPAIWTAMVLPSDTIRSSFSGSAMPVSFCLSDASASPICLGAILLSLNFCSTRKRDQVAKAEDVPRLDQALPLPALEQPLRHVEKTANIGTGILAAPFRLRFRTWRIRKHAESLAITTAGK